MIYITETEGNVSFRTTSSQGTIGAMNPKEDIAWHTEFSALRQRMRLGAQASALPSPEQPDALRRLPDTARPVKVHPLAATSGEQVCGVLA